MTVVFAPPIHTQAQKPRSLPAWFLSSFLLPSLLLCTAMEFGQLSLCAQSSLATPGTWNEWESWVKGGETERRSESKRKRRRECEKGRTTLFPIPLTLFLFKEQNGSRESKKEGREQSQSLLHLFYSCC